MRRTAIGLIWLAVLGVIAGSYGQKIRTHSPTDAANYVVKAYELSPGQAACFSTTDGTPSRFWYAWEGNGAELSRVSIDGIANFVWGDSAEGAADGGMELRVAYGDSGIYILFAVQDDAWASYLSGNDYGNDAVEFFGCKLPTSELYGDNMAVNLPCLNGDGTATGFPQQLTFDYFQMQIRFGGIEPVQTIGFSRWNPLMKDVPRYGCDPGSILQFPVTTTVESVGEYGIKIDILPQEGQWRGQEWLFPWRVWGGFGDTPLTRRHKGDRVAISFGYNDFDPGVQAMPTAMRWRNADPFTNTRAERLADSTIPLTSYDAWGDIEFSDPLYCPGIYPSYCGECITGAGVHDIPVRRSLEESGRMRWTGATLQIESADQGPHDRVHVVDSRGRTVLDREVSSSSTIPWPAGLRGVFSVRVGGRSLGTFVVP